MTNTAFVCLYNRNANISNKLTAKRVMTNTAFVCLYNRNTNISTITNLHNDVVDGNVDQFDKETDEAHDGKSNSCCHGNLLKLCK